MLLVACSSPSPSPIPTPAPPPTPAPTSKTGEEPGLPGCLEQQQGQADPEITVDIYEPKKAYNGTTLLPDNHNPEKPRIIEVNMSGEIVWEYRVPQNLKQYTNPGFDCELLSNNNVLIVLPRHGIHEIDRSSNAVWSYLTPKISHDADRLPNGNALITRTTEIVEVTTEGEIVWRLQLKDIVFEPREGGTRGFYKANRICQSD